MAKKNQWICGHVDNLWKETSVTKRDKIMLLENRPKTPTESTTNSRGVTSVTKRDKCDIFNLGIERDSVTTPPYRGVVMSRYPGPTQSHTPRETQESSSSTSPSNPSSLSDTTHADTPTESTAPPRTPSHTNPTRKFKAEDGKQSKEQIAWGQWCGNNGEMYAVVKNLDNTKSLFERCTHVFQQPTAAGAAERMGRMKFEVEGLPNGEFLVPMGGGMYQKVNEQVLGEFLREIENGKNPTPAPKKRAGGPRKRRTRSEIAAAKAAADGTQESAAG